MTTEELKRLSSVELMLRWNHYCDTHNREWDCIRLNEDRTYVEAFDNDDQAMNEIVNGRDPEFKRNEGYLITLYDGKGYYRGMEWIPEGEIYDRLDIRSMLE